MTDGPLIVRFKPHLSPEQMEAAIEEILSVHDPFIVDGGESDMAIGARTYRNVPLFAVYWGSGVETMTGTGARAAAIRAARHIVQWRARRIPS